MPLPDLEKIPELPVDDAGPVFSAPWQAQAFALVVNLQQQGVFSWDEWATELGASIDRARAAGDPDLGDTYYDHWLAALEKIATEKGLVSMELLAEHKKQAHDAQQALHAHKH